MNCASCGRGTEYREPLPEVDGYLVIPMSDHGEEERWARWCPSCEKPFCGECSFPRWQELKRERGLTGRQLADEMNADPDALFSEMPSCPECRGLTEERGPSSCFLATAAYGTDRASDVRALRRYRDQVLRRTVLGRACIATYERLSPPLADRLRGRPRLRASVRTMVFAPLARLARAILASPRARDS